MRKPLTRGMPSDSTLREIEKRHNQLSRYPATPDAKQLQDGEIFILEEDGLYYIAIRDGNSIRKVEVS